MSNITDKQRNKQGDSRSRISTIHYNLKDKDSNADILHCSFKRDGNYLLSVETSHPSHKAARDVSVLFLSRFLTMMIMMMIMMMMMIVIMALVSTNGN